MHDARGGVARVPCPPARPPNREQGPQRDWPRQPSFVVPRPTMQSLIGAVAADYDEYEAEQEVDR